jgi:hypothetical protein
MLLAWKVKKKAESRAKDEYNTVAAGGKSWPLPLPLPWAIAIAIAPSPWRLSDCHRLTSLPTPPVLLYYWPALYSTRKTEH